MTKLVIKTEDGKCVICEKKDDSLRGINHMFEISNGLLVVTLCSAECYFKFIKLIKDL